MKIHSGSFFLKISEAKTNVIALNLIRSERIDEKEFELVPMFKYLGSMISMKDTTSQEIKVRLVTTRSLTNCLTNIWKDDDKSISMKKSGALFNMAVSPGHSGKRTRNVSTHSRCEYECSGYVEHCEILTYGSEIK